jgi:acetoacetyl-CoA reductase
VTRPFIDGMLDTRLGPDHQHLLDQRLQGAVRPDQLLRRKSRHAWLHKSPCAQEVARKGVTVNTVSPGYLDTKMVTNMSEEVVKQVIAGIPGRPSGTA